MDENQGMLMLGELPKKKKEKNPVIWSAHALPEFLSGRTVRIPALGIF